MSYSSGYPFHTAFDGNAAAGPSHSHTPTPTHHNIPLSSPLEYPMVGGTTCLGPGPGPGPTGNSSQNQNQSQQGSAPSTWIPQSNTLSSTGSQQASQAINWNVPPGNWSPVPNLNHIPPPAETGLSFGGNTTRGENRSEGLFGSTTTAGSGSGSGYDGGNLGYGSGSHMAYTGRSGDGGDDWMPEDLGLVFKKRLLGKMDVVDVGRETTQLQTILNELISLLQPFTPSAPQPATSPPPPFLHTRFARLSSLVVQALHTLSPHVHPTLSLGFTPSSDLAKHLGQQHLTPSAREQGYGVGQRQGLGTSGKSLEEMTPAEREMEVIRKRRDALIAKAAATAAAAAAANAGPSNGGTVGAGVGVAPGGKGAGAGAGGPKAGIANASGARGSTKADAASASPTPRSHPPKSSHLQTQPRSLGYQPTRSSPLTVPTSLHHPSQKQNQSQNQNQNQNQTYPFDSLSVHQQQQQHPRHQHSPLGNLAALTEASDLVSHSHSNANTNTNSNTNSHFDPFGSISSAPDRQTNGNTNGNGNQLSDNGNGGGIASPFDFMNTVDLNMIGINNIAEADANGNGGNGGGPGANASASGGGGTGRCHGCGSNVTSEWMRGPDGPGSLCDSCGIHYAKLIAKKDIQRPSTTTLPPHQMQYLYNLNHNQHNQPNQHQGQQQQQQQYFGFDINTNSNTNQSHSQAQSHGFTFNPTMMNMDMNYLFNTTPNPTTSDINEIILDCHTNNNTNSTSNEDNTGSGINSQHHQGQGRENLEEGKEAPQVPVPVPVPVVAAAI
ncbi:hypothetical protein IAT40_007311 [Kwoniella sp. CBS 6097]